MSGWCNKKSRKDPVLGRRDPHGDEVDSLLLLICRRQQRLETSKRFDSNTRRFEKKRTFEALVDKAFMSEWNQKGEYSLPPLSIVCDGPIVIAFGFQTTHTRKRRPCLCRQVFCWLLLLATMVGQFPGFAS